MRTKTGIMLFVSLLLLVVFTGSPAPFHGSSAVLHQHERYPDEQGIDAGFSENGVLTTHLPIIILRADGRMIPGAAGATKEELYCDYSIIDNPDYVNHSDDVPTWQGRMAINIRGQSSRHFIKKQYAIRTVNRQHEPLKTSLLGMPAESTWVLNGSYIDKSQLRNYILYNIAGEIMSYAPRCRLCEVFVTNEKREPVYQGVYTLIEKPKVSKNRLNLEPYSPARTQTAFIVQVNKRMSNLRIDHLKPDDKDTYPFNLEYPRTDILTEDSLRYIEKELLQFEKALYDADHTGKTEQLAQYLDMRSFADYYIINEFFQNYDAGIRSTYLYKNPGSPFFAGPVWDFDGAFDNFTGLEFSNDMLAINATFYYSCLLQNKTFAETVCERYEELRRTFLSEEYLLAYIEAADRYLGSAALRNCDRWYEGDYAAYRDDIEGMKRFVIKRGKWMDRHFVEHIALR